MMLSMYLTVGGVILAVCFAAGIWLGRKITMPAVREIEQARDQAIKSWRREHDKNLELQKQNAGLIKAQAAAREQQEKEDEINAMDSNNIANALDREFGGLPDDGPADT